MSSVKVLLKEEKINKAGEAPLYLRIIKDRKAKYISLGLRVKPADWQSEISRVKKSHPNSKRVNVFISHKVAEAEGISLELQMQSKSVAPNQIKRAILGKASESFLRLFERHINFLDKSGKIGSLDKASAVHSKLKTFLGNQDILISEITVSFLKQYEAYLRDELGNSINTIHSNLKIIRKLINDAINEDLLSPEKNPFLKFKLRLEKTAKSYLSEDELELIWQLPLNEAVKMFHHRNIFVFSAYAGGLRISDLLQLKWSNFSGTHVRVTMHKTGDLVSVKLPNKALDIINLYKGIDAKASDYIFPFLDSAKDYSDPRVLHRAISSAIAYANRDLKAIAKKAGVETIISFHSSRHTFATQALAKGMPIEYVSKLLGHSSIKTTQIYAKIINEKLDEAMDVFN